MYNKFMIVKRVIPSGYCKGVIKAINLAKNTRLSFPNSKIYVLGNIVHNYYVTKMLSELNIITLDDTNISRIDLLDQIDEGIVILTAHGTSDEVKSKAILKGLKVVDATCEDVNRTKEIINEHLMNDYDVIYFGKKNHPESNAIISLSNRIHLLTNVSDIEKLDINNEKIIITNQTTMSFLELKEMIDILVNKYPYAKVIKEICDATSSRQLAITNIKDADVLYIVGDTKSNNTNKLVEIAKKSGIKNTFLISNKDEINKNDLIGQNVVYVSAGASTPPDIINEVIEHLESLNLKS